MPGSKAYEMLNLPQFRHRVAIQMTWDELHRLVAIFGGHEVFQSTIPKPQVHSRYQLGVWIFRLSHGHTADNTAREFGCCGLAVEHPYLYPSHSLSSMAINACQAGLCMTARPLA